MKVILLENVRKIGSIGEIIDVKRGFARNFLIANKKALFASKNNIKEVSTENNELYGSVKPTEISKVLEEAEQVKVNPSLIQPSTEIKSLGDFKVTINLHSEVQTQIVIKILAQEEIK